MSLEQKTTQLLEEQTPALSVVQKEALWAKIESSILAPAPIPTPFLFTFIQTRYMASFILALMLVLGSTGTVMASNSARPGDLLYPIDRATETVEGSFLRGDVKAHFTAELVQERVDELHSLLSDKTKKSSDGQLSDEGKKNASEAALSALDMVDSIHLNNETRHQLLVKLRAEVRGIDVGIKDDRLKDDENGTEQEDDNQNKNDNSNNGEHGQGNRGHGDEGKGEGRNGNDGIDITASTSVNLDTRTNGTGRSDGDQENRKDDSTSAPHESINSNLKLGSEIELDD